MKKMKRIAAMTAALLICTGNMGYMPESTKSIGGFTANAAEVAAESVEINETNFPDAIFRKYVADNFDKDGDNVLSAEEIKAVTEINVANMGISDLTGLEYFTELTYLRCLSNNLTTLDVSKNAELKRLNCGTNQLSSLDLSKNTALEELFCQFNQLTAIDVSHNTALTDLQCALNQITALDVSKNTALTSLYCECNQLKTLDLSNNAALTSFGCEENQLTSLDVSNNKELVTLTCYKNQLTFIDISQNTKINTGLICNDNAYKIAITDGKFDLSTLPTGFDAAKTSSWTNATVEGNILTIEDVTKEVTYKYDCGNNKSEIFKLLMTFSTGDVNNNGSIDSSDATLILSNYSAIATGGDSTFSAEQTKAADINNDGKCDSIDASLILAYYAHTSTGGTGTIEEYISKANAEEKLKALKEKKESEVQLFAAAYIGFADDTIGDDAVTWIKENGPVFYENYSFVEDIPSGQIAGTPMGELYCIVPFDENSTVAINRIVRDENGNGSYENVIYRSESGEPVLLFCNNSGVEDDTQVTVTDSYGNKVVWFPGLDEKLMMNCPYNANYDTFIYDFSQYQEILEKEHTIRKKNGWKLPTAADLQFTNWSGVDYRGSEVIGTYSIEFGEDTAYIKWIDGDEEHEFKDVEWQLEVEKDVAVVTFNFNEFAGILQYNFLLNETGGMLYTAVNFTNEDTLDENLKLYRILDRYEYSETNS